MNQAGYAFVMALVNIVYVIRVMLRRTVAKFATFRILNDVPHEIFPLGEQE